jgi:small subunit ribosomal protein S9
MTEKTTAPKKPTTRKPAAARTGAPRKRVVKKDAEHAAHAPAHHTAHVATAAEAKPHHVIKSTTQNFYAVGRRKTAVGQVILTSGNGTVTVNELPFASYFMTTDLQGIVLSPLSAMGVEKNFNLRGKVHGGGIHSQAEALRHAVARAVIKMDPETRRTLKKLGYLTRDPRVKERKKPGLKRARRAPQFSKR